MNKELLDLEVLVEMKKAAPRVMVVPFDIASLVVRAMVDYAKDEKGNIDQDGKLYWQLRVKELHETGKLGDLVSLNQLGRTLKALGLESWRKMDGFHVAWSHEQLNILKVHFKVS